MKRALLTLLVLLAFTRTVHAATPVEKLRVIRKLKSITIPEIILRDATIHDAFKFIIDAGQKADTACAYCCCTQ